MHPPARCAFAGLGPAGVGTWPFHRIAPFYPRRGVPARLVTSRSRRARLKTVFSLGANLGDPIVQLRDAVEALGRVLSLDAVSSVYRTEPVGLVEQPDFYNLVVSGRTERTVFDLHAAVEEIERSLGRVRTVRDGPRHIDVDLLAYGELVYVSPSLTVPHPRLGERSFVLVPLVEVEPEWRHPVSGASAADLLGELVSPSWVERVGGL